MNDLKHRVIPINIINPMSCYKDHVYVQNVTPIGLEKVRCGNHYRDNCGQCPFENSTYHGRGWCYGVCQWSEYGIKSPNKDKQANKVKWRVHLHQLGLGAETRQVKKFNMSKTGFS